MTIATSIKEIEELIVDEFMDISDMTDPYCWIASNGKIIPCGHFNHSNFLHSTFTDEHNPEHADYVISVGTTNYERYFEEHRCKMTFDLLTVPRIFTAKQKISMEKILKMFPESYFKDKNYRLLCSPMGRSSEFSRKFDVVVYENNRVKWEKY